VHETQTVKIHTVSSPRSTLACYHRTKIWVHSHRAVSPSETTYHSSVGSTEGIGVRGEKWLFRLTPLALAVFIFLGSNLPVIKAALNPLPGWAPLFALRARDVAQYLTWIQASQTHLLLPNFHAPWLTEPALFNPVCLLLGMLSRLTRISAETVYNTATFAFYALAAYALLFVLRSFTNGRAQLLAAAVITLCAVPLKSLLLLPEVVLSLGIPKRLPGLNDLWSTADGFLKGGMFVSTLGTATVWLAFGLLARFLATSRIAYLVATCLVAFLSAISHPFEAFMIAAAGSAALCLARPRRSRRFLESAALGVNAALGLAPYVILALRVDWLSDAARLNRSPILPPWTLISALGLPTIVCLALLLVKPRVKSTADLLLRCWFLTALIGLHMPWLPWSQHLTNGFSACTGLLIARQMWEVPAVFRLVRGYRRPAWGLAATLVLLSVSVYPIAYWTGRDARRGAISTSHRAAIDWMRANVDSSSLVLAPPSEAPWYATVPMHSLASHSIFSLGMAEQRKLSAAFFEGTMDRQFADKFLSDYGVRYVVAPVDGPTRNYLDGCVERARLGSLLVCEFPGRSMKPYRSPGS